MATTHQYKTAALEQAVYMAEARIENGSTSAEAFDAMQDDVGAIMSGQEYEALEASDFHEDTGGAAIHKTETPIDLDDLYLVYVDESGEEHYQPAGDVTEVGTLIDPETDDDMPIVRGAVLTGPRGVYTVTLLLPDYLGSYSQFFTEHTFADNANEAIDQVLDVACADHDVDSEEGRADYMVVSCFRGKHYSLPAE